MGTGNDEHQHDQHQGPDPSSRTGSPPDGERAGGNGEPATGPQVITTDDPSIRSESAYLTDQVADPDQAMVIEASTSRIREAHGSVIPRVYTGVVEHVAPAHERHDPGKRPGDDKAGKASADKGRKGLNGAGDHPGKDRPGPGRSHQKDQGSSGGRGKDPRGRRDQAPSLMRVLLFSGIVSLICGMIGGAGYSHFFGSSGSDDQKGSGSGSSKDSGSSKKSDSSDSGSDKGSETQSGSDSSSRADNGPGSTSADQWAWDGPVRRSGFPA